MKNQNKTEEIRKELKEIASRLDDAIEALGENGATYEEVKDLIEALTKIKGARARLNK